MHNLEKLNMAPSSVHNPEGEASLIFIQRPSVSSQKSFECPYPAPPKIETVFVSGTTGPAVMNRQSEADLPEAQILESPEEPSLRAS